MNTKPIFNVKRSFARIIIFLVIIVGGYLLTHTMTTMGWGYLGIVLGTYIFIFYRAYSLSTKIEQKIQTIEQQKNSKEQEFSLITEYNPAVFYITNQEGDAEFVSPNILTWIGYTQEDFTKNSKLWYSLIHKQDLSKVIEKDIEAYKLYTFTYRILFKDGKYHWIKDEYRFVPYEDGSLHAIGTITNIDEEKKFLSELQNSEEKLKESEANYRLLFDESPIAKIIFDKETYKILEVNRRALELHGYTKEEFLALTVLDIRSKEAADVLKEDFSSAEVYKKSRIRQVKKKNGDTLTVETIAHETVFEGRKVIISVINDITEQENAKRAIEESEKRYKSLFEHFLVGAFRSKLDGTFVDVNSVFAKMLGYSREELLNSKAHIVYTSIEDREKYVHILREQGKVESYELSLLKKRWLYYSYY